MVRSSGGALPGNGHREEEGVEAGVIEPLADVAAGREYEPFGSVWNRGEPVGGVTPFLGRHPALEHHQVTYDAAEMLCEVLEVVFTLGSRMGERPSWIAAMTSSTMRLFRVSLFVSAR